MATAVSHPMTLTPFANSNQCDPDVEEWFNFSELQADQSGNGVSSSHMPASSAPSALTSPATTIAPLDQSEDFQKPSFEYDRFKQQTGLPSGSVPGLHTAFQGFSNSATGLDDMSLMNGWSTGVGMDSDLNMDSEFSNGLPAFFYPGDGSQQDDFIDPSNISQPEEPTNVRVWPGMHQQQALAKAQQAQAQLQQQKRVMEQQQQQQQQQRPQNRSQASRRNGSQPTDARTEETIARVVNQIRQNSQMASQQDSSSQNVLPHIVRMRKDEEDMDEDERLLASDEGKKLSSKERRQLRNKVSARAFRSRRKEYIGQLEGEVAVKTNECNDLRTQNRALMEENARSRAFIEKLLRHRAFSPFLEDLSREESFQTGVSTASDPSPQPSFKDVNPYQQRPQQQLQDITQAQNPQIGMALVPETPLDLSMLSLQTNWGSQNIGMGYQQPQVFAVMDVPAGPVNPINTETLSGKGYEAFDEPESVDEVKPDFPTVPKASSTQSIKATKPAETEEDRAFDNDPAFALYHASETSSPATSTTVDELPSFTNIIPSEKAAQFEIVVINESMECAMQRVERICASMEPVYQRLVAFNSSN